MDTITKPLGARGQFIRRLWEEYEGCETPEANIVKQIDKFEFALQASEYEKGKKLN